VSRCPNPAAFAFGYLGTYERQSRSPAPIGGTPEAR